MKENLSLEEFFNNIAKLLKSFLYLVYRTQVGLLINNLYIIRFSLKREKLYKKKKKIQKIQRYVLFIPKTVILFLKF